MDITSNESEYTIVQSIASGSFGSVVLVKSSLNGRLFAVKIIPSDPGTTGDLENMWLRALRLQQVPHTIHSLGCVILDTLPPKLAPLVETKKKKQCFVLIVMPYVKGMTLRDWLGQTHPLTRAEVRKWTLQLAQFAHGAYQSLRVTHNDLKLGNIIVSSMDRGLRVIDFTFAMRPDTESDSFTWSRGTLCYMAPEKLFFSSGPPAYCCRTKGASDVWSIGTIMSTMALSGRAAPVSPGERAPVANEHGCFSPLFTDSLYHMLPRSRPWFVSLVDEMVCRSGLDPEWIIQGARLFLWTRALYIRTPGDPGRITYRLPTNRELPGIEQTPLHAILTIYGDKLIKCYDNDGFETYERIRDALVESMGSDLFRVYLKTQHWVPETRTRSSTTNPFDSLIRELGEIPQNIPFMAKTAVPRTITYASLNTFIGQCVVAPCETCGGPSNIRCQQCGRGYACDEECFTHSNGCK